MTRYLIEKTFDKDWFEILIKSETNLRMVGEDINRFDGLLLLHHFGERCQVYGRLNSLSHIFILMAKMNV